MIASHGSFGLKTFLNCSVFFTLICQLFAFDLSAQTEVELFHFKELEDSLTTKVVSKLPEGTVEYKPYISYPIGYTSVNEDRYYLLIDRFEEFFLIRDGVESKEVWSFKSEYSVANGWFVPQDSYLLFLNNAPIISTKSYRRLHGSYDGEQLFFSARDDTLKQLGKLPVEFYIEDESDGDIPAYVVDKVNRRLQIASSNGKTILIKAYFTQSFYGGLSASFREEYHLNHEKLSKIKVSPTKEHFITRESAEEFLKEIFQEYYSEIWRNASNDRKRNRQRASLYLQIFDNLQKLRPDFAPAYYNKACMQAILGHQEPALRDLRKSFDLDESYRAKALQDSDLKSLQQSPEFRKLVKSE